MKILCLHGSYGSAANFQVQLEPIIHAMEKSGSAQFKWIDGGYTATPPPGFETYFGGPPYYRFMEYDGVAAVDDILSKIRELPEGESPEATMRKLVAEQETIGGPALLRTLARLFEILDEDPDIEGLLGYSGGAAMAATIVLEERRRWEDEGRPRRIKCAIFFTGWPPVYLRDGVVKTLLADESEDIIDVPTCHIIGCNDPYIDGVMALYNVCDEDTATLFDHGKGHTVPRDPRTIEELALAIEGVLNHQPRYSE
ncbi:hypothetical protein GJ744_001516 [Endocarpon pusillum]|uniref:Serine hydrolase domain-containing protein n=1 Tax=Endocarpon pusillum TaxID=364733 RepID=A0A8H7AH02_9EURO|nr:hypothetical protein GJ744_001516 [Endocarpon pusillum]